ASKANHAAARRLSFAHLDPRRSDLRRCRGRRGARSRRATSAPHEAATHEESSAALILRARRRGAFREGPRAIRELEHQEPVVLACAPNGARPVIKVNLRRAPVGTARAPLAGRNVIRSRTRRCRPSRIVVGDFLWPLGIANVENTNAGVEEAAGEGGRMLLVVDAAVVAAISEYREAGEIRKDLRAV